jgi:hypothetical protein
MFNISELLDTKRRSMEIESLRPLEVKIILDTGFDRVLCSYT